MNLIVDIGNSTVKAAVFDGEKLLVRRRLTGHLPDALAMLADEFHPIEACAYASVGTEMPQVEQMLRHLVPNALLRVTGLTPSPLRSAYRTPETLGADRWAAVVGAAKLLPATDLMVVDVGTCITYDYVSAEGTYQGGNISLGLGMRLRALHEQTARLPLVWAATGSVRADKAAAATIWIVLFIRMLELCDRPCASGVTAGISGGHIRGVR